MKEFFKILNSKINNFLPLDVKRNKINHMEGFPVVGFLINEKKTQLEKVLGLKIHNVEFFEQALTHRSYMHVIGTSTGIRSNERLEFLGDAVLGMVVSDFLFQENSDLFEGQLTKMRSWIVNKNSLAFCCKSIGLDKFVMLSFSAEKALKNGSDSILADMLEAVIAAIYLDLGIDAAGKFIFEKILPIVLVREVMEDHNYKSILLEKVQAFGHPAPQYEVLQEVGPDHDKLFTVGVYVQGVLLGTGHGRSKKQAEQTAAQDALAKDSLTNISEQKNGNINI